MDKMNFEAPFTAFSVCSLDLPVPPESRGKGLQAVVSEGGPQTSSITRELVEMHILSATQTH